jgi:heme/copper-type cytochrome/quinol oxidase subunit 4
LCSTHRRFGLKFVFHSSVVKRKRLLLRVFGLNSVQRAVHVLHFLPLSIKEKKKKRKNINLWTRETEITWAIASGAGLYREAVW